MKTLLFTSACGILATIVTGVFAWDTDNTALLETYKLCLSFTLIGIAGTVVKAVVDTVVEQGRERKQKIAEEERAAQRAVAELEKEQQRRYQEWEIARTAILQDFIEIFSAFYGLRKLYHSALSKGNSIFTKGTDEYHALIRELLKKATDLEGRYGALKVLIIRHFGLPSGKFENHPLDQLIQERDAARTEADRLRLSLDILGEAYDDWRHALEKDRKIDVSASWEAYREVLAFLDSQRWSPLSNNP